MDRALLRTLSLALCACASASSPVVTLVLHPLHPGDDEARAVLWDGQRWRAEAVESSARMLTEEAAGCETEEHPPPGSPDFYFSLGMSILMICLAGVMAGCTMGVLSLDPLKLKLKLLEGTPDEQRYAKAVLPVLRSHHHLLVALLLVNAAANEALPLFLDKIVDEKTVRFVSARRALSSPRARLASDARARPASGARRPS